VGARLTGELAIALLALGVGSALFPAQIAITLVLLGSSARQSGRSAVAWVGGLAVVRLVQGVVFGLIGVSLGRPEGLPDGAVIVFQLSLAAAFFGLAILKFRRGREDGADPPKRLAGLGDAPPRRAFLFGMAALTLSVKGWILTLGAIEVIAEAQLAPPGPAVGYLAFTVLALGFHVAAIAATWLAPQRAHAALAQLSAALSRHERAITVGLGIAFGTWFLWQALGTAGIRA
jgi:hypothetical protein